MPAPALAPGPGTADPTGMLGSGLQGVLLSSVTRLNRVRDDIGGTLERLATGKRINRASDDPAGAVASANLKAQAVDIEKRIVGLERESLWLGAREGAYAALSDLLIDLKSTVVSAANRGALGAEEREALAVQAEEAVKAIDWINQTARFQGDRLLGIDLRTLGGAEVTRTDADGNETRVGVGLRDLGTLLRGDTEELAAAEAIVESAVSGVARQRGAIGARITNGIEPEIAALRVQLEEILGANSLIEDTDYARETAELVRQQILEQASLFSVQIAQQSAASVLELLRPLRDA